MAAYAPKRQLKRHSIFKLTRMGAMIPKEIKYNLHYKPQTTEKQNNQLPLPQLSSPLITMLGRSQWIRNNKTTNRIKTWKGHAMSSRKEQPTPDRRLRTVSNKNYRGGWELTRVYLRYSFYAEMHKNWLKVKSVYINRTNIRENNKEIRWSCNKMNKQTV